MALERGPAAGERRPAELELPTGDAPAGRCPPAARALYMRLMIFNVMLYLMHLIYHVNDIYIYLLVFRRNSGFHQFLSSDILTYIFNIDH